MDRARRRGYLTEDKFLDLMEWRRTGHLGHLEQEDVNKMIEYDRILREPHENESNDDDILDEIEGNVHEPNANASFNIELNNEVQEQDGRVNVQQIERDDNDIFLREYPNLGIRFEETFNANSSNLSDLRSEYPGVSIRMRRPTRAHPPTDSTPSNLSPELLALRNAFIDETDLQVEQRQPTETLGGLQLEYPDLQLHTEPNQAESYRTRERRNRENMDNLREDFPNIFFYDDEP